MRSRSSLLVELGLCVPGDPVSPRLPLLSGAHCPIKELPPKSTLKGQSSSQPNNQKEVCLTGKGFYRSIHLEVISSVHTLLVVCK